MSQILTFDRIRFKLSDMMAYSFISRTEASDRAWGSQRDETQNFGEFESLAFRDVKDIFLVSLYQFITLGDDMFGTLSANSQVKNLIMRNVDEERHTAD